MTSECISVILPVYNEEGNIAACLRGLAKALDGLEHELLVCYDFDEDTTLPAIARMEDKPPTVKLVRNTLGKGAAAAIQAGFQAARGDVLVVTMADLSDPPEVIPAMARKIRQEGADVVSGSRYMKGGSQTGGPRLKTLLSRAAGLSLRWLGGVATHDATTNFRAYSRKLLQSVRIESRHGFELALELTVKAHLHGYKVGEVPSSWRDRSAGESRFQLWKWMPRYLRWYLLAVGDPLFVGFVLLGATIAALVFALRNAPVLPFWDEWAFVPVLTGQEPFSPGWLWAQHYEHRIPLAKILWLGVSRISGGDPRWLLVLITMLFSGAAALILRGLRAFRGRTVWTDAFVPLLFLHWDHWENLTWPFQIPFALHLFVVSFLLSQILMLRRRHPRSLAQPVGAGLLALPLLGGSGLPFAGLLAAGWMLVGRRNGGTRMLLLPLATLLLTGAYFLGYHPSAAAPPSPGVGASLTVAWEFLTGSVGVQGSRLWPSSGSVTLAVLALTVGVLIRSLRRQDLRLPACGVLLMLAGTVALALMIGVARAGMSPYAGFFDRYVTMSCLFPAIAYVATEFGSSAILGRIVRTTALALMAALFVSNASHAWDLTSARRRANQSITCDVAAGVPVPLLAGRHSDQHLGPIDVFEERLRRVAQARLYLFRRIEPVEGISGITPLKDGRVAFDVPSSGNAVPLIPGTRDVRIEFGRLRWTIEPVTFRAMRIRDGGPPERIWTSTLTSPTFQTGTLSVTSLPGDRISIDVEAESPGVRYWVILDLR